MSHSTAEQQSAPHPSMIVLHAGAGTILRSKMTAAQERAYHDSLRAALEAGLTVLKSGGSALDAVTASVMYMEDCPLFNAGRGAVYTATGTHEMDAAIMSGKDRACGAVAGICGPRHPILAARAVMERTEHVFLAGDGARRFLDAQVDLEKKEPAWFGTESRLAALNAELARRAAGEPDDGDPARKHGTVGAAALDSHGHLAAATSTGGMTAKMSGRVGDSPVIGAGTWADDRTCALSATGHGEFFVRLAVGHEVDARMRLAGQSLQKAAADVISEGAALGATGGVVAVDRHGNISMPINCEGMYRAWVDRAGAVHTAIFADEADDTGKTTTQK